jgi:hypothetical protein
MPPSRSAPEAKTREGLDPGTRLAPPRFPSSAMAPSGSARRSRTREGLEPRNALGAPEVSIKRDGEAGLSPGSARRSRNARRFGNPGTRLAPPRFPSSAMAKPGLARRSRNAGRFGNPFRVSIQMGGFALRTKSRKYDSNHLPAWGAPGAASATAHISSKRGWVGSETPSDSPGGLIQK